MLLVGRLMVGMCAGSYCILTPIYVGEIAAKDIRGELGTYFQLMITIGILFVYGVGSVVSVFWLSLICGLVTVLFGVVFVFVPETPTHYVSWMRYMIHLRNL
jgi:MFS family permease